MSKTIARNPEYLRWLHELLFSVYLPFLVVSAHERGGGGSWSVKLIVWGVANGYLRSYGRRMEDYRVDVASFLLIWVPVFFIFLCLRFFSDSSLSRVVLRSLAGVVAVAGFPLACLYESRGGLFFLEVELAMATVILGLWAYRKWPVSAPLTTFLLFSHFALWSTFGGSAGGAWLLLWPFWHWTWGFEKYMWLAYPLLGFCSTLLWAAYVRRSGTSEQLGSPTVAG